VEEERRLEKGMDGTWVETGSERRKRRKGIHPPEVTSNFSAVVAPMFKTEYKSELTTGHSFLDPTRPDPH